MSYKITDEIIVGTWVGGADDGSGLRTMIYNYGVTLDIDGTGTSFDWHREENRIEEFVEKIEWRLPGGNILEIRFTDSSDDMNKWEEIRIEISDFIGAYDSAHFKLVDEGKGTFWTFPEPLYKSKYDKASFKERVETIMTKKESFISRMFKKLKE